MVMNNFQLFFVVPYNEACVQKSHLINCYQKKNMKIKNDNNEEATDISFLNIFTLSTC